MKKNDITYLLDKLNHQRNKTQNRYLNPIEVHKTLINLSERFKQEKIGVSVNGNTIKKLIWGNGSTRVMMWSQMHGNESTTTRALIDLLFLFDENPSYFEDFYEDLKLIIIPIVNPDGAINWTRFNANQVDLNRDAMKLSQPESKLLMRCFETSQPHFCLNLHDQRIIYGVNGNFAGMSFLAPSYNKEQLVNSNREKSMSLIVKTADFLSNNGLNGKIGRYDETYNENCFGDFFQHQGTPTVLVEAGQLQLDYNRDFSVYYSLLSFLILLKSISYQDFKDRKVKNYYQIPMNEQVFVDLLIKNVNVNQGIFHVAVMYDMNVFENQLTYNLKIHSIDFDYTASHRVINADMGYLYDTSGQVIKQLSVGDYLSGLRVNSVNFSLF